MDKSREEYNKLARHIEGQFRLIVQVFTVSIVAAVALLGYVLKVLTAGGVYSDLMVLLPLAPLAITTPCAYLIRELRKEIFKWGAYVQVYLEDGGDWRYETELTKYMRIHSHVEKESFNLIGIAYWVLFGVCGGVSVGWGVWGMYEGSMMLGAVIVLASAVSIVFGLLWLYRTWWADYKDIPVQYREKYVRRWTEVKQMGNGGVQMQDGRDCDEIWKKLDRMDNRMEQLVRGSRRWERRQSIFAVALSSLGLSVTLVFLGSESTREYLVFAGISLWVVAVVGFIVLAVTDRGGNSAN